MIFLVCCLLALAVAAQAETRALKSGYLVAVSEKAFDQCSGMIAAKDKEAFVKMQSAGLCGITAPGVPVYVVETHLFKGRAEIRLQGSTGVLWTNIEAVMD
jgi:hypothetical protein